MNDQKQQLYFLLGVLVVVVVLVFFIFRPFLYAIILAAVFATVSRPVYRRMLSFTRERGGLSAFATILIIAIFIFTPITFLGFQIFQESQQLYLSVVSRGGDNTITNALDNLASNLNNYFPGMPELSLDINQYLRQGLDWLISHLNTIFSSLAKVMINFFIFLIATYYLLKDGRRIKEAVVRLSPLIDSDDEEIFRKLELAVNSVVKGSLTIALIQGVLTAVGFTIFGIPNAIIWGTLTALTALIPGVGTAIVLIPAIIFLFFTSGFLHGLGLLVWGIVAVGLVDNLLGPKLVGRGMKLHSLVVLLSVLGGLAFFGPIGFLLGPLTVSLLFALLDIYFSFRARESQSDIC